MRKLQRIVPKSIKLQNCALILSYMNSQALVENQG
jgi:hypothetical protein